MSGTGRDIHQPDVSVKERPCQASFQHIEEQHFGTSHKARHVHKAQCGYVGDLRYSIARRYLAPSQRIGEVSFHDQEA